jgi:predicted LPLAT superfamily acyltransferase/glycosyltransferase involved in cell wall biosynthesis
MASGGNVNIIAIIPTYNHHNRINDVVTGLKVNDLPVIIVDDGSDQTTRDVLANIDDVILHRHDRNLGKGAAVISGFREARRLGYSHALQVDADGQHDLSAVPNLMQAARRQPEDVVAGIPIYDDTIPLGRKLGRWITHFWVWIETLSFQIRDSMCGFRIYPLAQTMHVVDTSHVGQVMDFDTEIIVRLYWAGVDVSEVPVKVTYPNDNHSNFRGVLDNVAISLMHTRLVFGMLWRLPGLLFRSGHYKAQHWSGIQERGVYAGVFALATIVRLFGVRVCAWVLFPVTVYFWMTGGPQRRASFAYLERSLGRPASWRDSLRHFMSFSVKSLETFATWTGVPQELTFDYSKAELLEDATVRSRGLVLMISHMGNVEILRAGLGQDFRERITLFVHTKHALQFNRVLAKFSPQAAINMIQVTEIGPDTIIDLQERIERGEWVAIAGDRTPVQGDQRISTASFLGQQAGFPQGPYILASLLKCPLYHMTCAKRDDGVREVVFDRIAEQVKRNRSRDGDNGLGKYVAHYAELLERLCKTYPYQWYNFYDFWSQGR